MKKGLSVNVISPIGVSGLSFSIRQNRSGEDYATMAIIGGMNYYAVFDGHGCSGEQSMSSMKRHVSTYLKDYLHYHIADGLEGVNMDSLTMVKNAFVKIFNEVDRALHQRGSTFGSTCTLVLVSKNIVYQVNAGDSKSILLDKSGRVVSETVCHDPNDCKESDRITSCGGYVEDGRVDGMLATSRGFGDYMLKIIKGKYGPTTKVSCVPDVTSTPRKDAYLVVLGSDGLFFPGLTNANVVDVLRKVTLKQSSSALLEYACADERNGEDDIAVIVATI